MIVLICHFSLRQRASSQSRERKRERDRERERRREKADRQSERDRERGRECVRESERERAESFFSKKNLCSPQGAKEEEDVSRRGAGGRVVCKHAVQQLHRGLVSSVYICTEVYFVQYT